MWFSLTEQTVEGGKIEEEDFVLNDDDLPLPLLKHCIESNIF